MPSKASYNHESVALDGETFAQCEFRACRSAAGSFMSAASAASRLCASDGEGG